MVMFDQDFKMNGEEIYEVTKTEFKQSIKLSIRWTSELFW